MAALDRMKKAAAFGVCEILSPSVHLWLEAGKGLRYDTMTPSGKSHLWWRSP
jgi:hypothetical protein